MSSVGKLKPDEGRRRFWALMSSELGVARRDPRNSDPAVQQRLGEIEEFILRRYATLWKLHEKRLVSTSPAEFNEAAAALAIAFHQWDKELRKSDYDLLHDKLSLVELGGQSARCYVRLWREVAFDQLQSLKCHRELSISIPECEGGRFFYRPLPDGGTLADCHPADIEAVNTAFEGKQDFDFGSSSNPKADAKSPTAKQLEGPGVSGSLGYLGIVLNESEKSIVRNGINFPPIQLPLVQWNLFKLLFQCEGDGASSEQMEHMSGKTKDEKGARRTALHELRSKLSPLGLIITHGRNKPRILMEDPIVSVSKNSR